MWASCCNWLCLDTGEVEESGSTRRRAYTNSGYSGYPSPPNPELTCRACRGRCDSPSRRHVCVDCKKLYCSSCALQRELIPRCHTCQRFWLTAFERTELMKLKVKDLRDYLHLHEVSTQTCREKEELVELVLGQQTPSSSGSASEGATRGHVPSPAAPSPAAPSTSQEPPPPPGSYTPPDSEPPAQDDQQSSDVEDALPSGRRASLSDLSCADDIEALSVRQLKEILARNFVNYKGCCEKWELMERVTRLYNEQKDLQIRVTSPEDGSDPSPGVEENLCKICMDSPIDCVLLECGHMVTCTKCGKRMSECPICRQYVVRAVHVFRS
ncbi:E3 ubiquitin-protein ligase rififylin isoform X2 [Amia ocellicauda]|uniref:E3 ubiquitin-protein ligase rififylin isoform X2 n=1 Tax=Amia ocellicauda TaxID=2972642 RepID=UPI003463BA01